MIGITEDYVINLCKKNNGFTVARIENNTILCGNGDKLENGDYKIGAGKSFILKNWNSLKIMRKYPLSHQLIKRGKSKP